MKRILTLTIALAPVFLASCATIVTDDPQPVQISSSPEAARVEIYKTDGTRIDHGMTPITVNLSRDFGYFRRPAYRLVFEHPGYGTRKFTLRPRPNLTWYVGGNFLLGGLIGWLAVDPATGAMWTFDPFNAVLTPTGEVHMAAAHTNVAHHAAAVTNLPHPPATGVHHTVEHVMTNAVASNAPPAKAPSTTSTPQSAESK